MAVAVAVSNVLCTPAHLNPFHFTTSSTNSGEAPIQAEPEYDRESGLKAFDSSRTGVKGLVDAGISKLPPHQSRIGGIRCTVLWLLTRRLRKSFLEFAEI
ncbi:hypothetical protein NL676_021183 [Syzygium grande]|nr:hypothetical protein NL676_021183 [Syzygium grande]